MMGYRTPDIDGLAREGALFTDWYGQQCFTAGRAAFITGQSPFRTGLLKGHRANGRSFKVHLDSYNLLPYFKDEVTEGPRKEFFYWKADGQLANLYFDLW